MKIAARPDCLTEMDIRSFFGKPAQSSPAVRSLGAALPVTGKKRQLAEVSASDLKLLAATKKKKAAKVSFSHSVVFYTLTGPWRPYFPLWIVLSLYTLTRCYSELCIGEDIELTNSLALALHRVALSRTQTICLPLPVILPLHSCRRSELCTLCTLALTLALTLDAARRSERQRRRPVGTAALS